MIDFWTNLPGLITGLAEILTLVGAGIGFLVRSRRAAQRQRRLAEEGARLAATETKEKLERQLEVAHAQDLKDRDDLIAALRVDLRNKESRINQLTDMLIQGGQRD